MSGHSHTDVRHILRVTLSLLALNLSEPHFLALDIVCWLPEPQASLPCKPGLLSSLIILTEPLGILGVWEEIEDSLWGQSHTTLLWGPVSPASLEV